VTATPVNLIRAIGQAWFMTQLRDAEVVRLSYDRPELFAQIFERHHDAVRSYLVRRVGERGDELAAEVFIRAFELRRRFDPDRGEVRAWLFGIAANLIRRHKRDEQRRLAALARLDPSPSTASQTDAERRIDAQRQRVNLARGLSSLSHSDRETLLLFVWGGLTYEQVAQALSLPIGTVRSRISRARRVVRDELDPEFGEAEIPRTNPRLSMEA
jgi:RNA polymerase sigma factor (sigma-70 family)